MSLFDVLSRHFRFDRGPDNLPILARPRPGREYGRIQLAKVLGDLGFRTGIEIGVGEGYSANLWCEAVPGLKLVGIDPYIGGGSRKQRRYDRYRAKAGQLTEKWDFELWVMESLEAVDKFEDESVDFVQIDGNHTFDLVVQDLIQYTPKVRKGGLILLHDYCAFRRGGVVKAVDAYTHCHRIDPWYVTRDCNPVAFWERGVERA